SPWATSTCPGRWAGRCPGSAPTTRACCACSRRTRPTGTGWCGCSCSAAGRGRRRGGRGRRSWTTGGSESWWCGALGSGGRVSVVCPTMGTGVRRNGVGRGVLGTGWVRMRASVVEPVAGRGPETPDLPPSDLPVVLWPAPFLRAALAGTRGAALARLVADAVDLEGHALGGAVEADGAGAGTLPDLPDDALADLVVACGRVQSWAAGVQARVVAERAARESHPLAHSSLVAQVSGELAVTGAEASDVVVRGE